MIARRLTGLLVALLMLHLTLVGADVRCAEHGAAADAMHQPSGTHAHMTAQSSHAASESEQPCETPTQPECCRAMTSCAVSLVIRADDGAQVLPVVRHRITPALMRAPRSLVTSPDPPPPKA